MSCESLQGLVCGGRGWWRQDSELNASGGRWATQRERPGPAVSQPVSRFCRPGDREPEPVLRALLRPQWGWLCLGSGLPLPPGGVLENLASHGVLKTEAWILKVSCLTWSPRHRIRKPHRLISDINLPPAMRNLAHNWGPINIHSLPPRVTYKTVKSKN